METLNVLTQISIVIIGLFCGLKILSVVGAALLGMYHGYKEAKIEMAYMNSPLGNYEKQSDLLKDGGLVGLYAKHKN